MHLIHFIVVQFAIRLKLLIELQDKMHLDFVATINCIPFMQILILN